MACEDYPCCGHGPPPMGDGGGCPDSEGRFNCCGCGRKLAKNAPSALCEACHRHGRRHGYDGDRDYDDSDYYDRW